MPIPISVDPADDVAVDVAWNGEVFLVVFARNSTIRAVRVTTAGVALPIGEVVMCTAVDLGPDAVADVRPARCELGG